MTFRTFSSSGLGRGFIDITIRAALIHVSLKVSDGYKRHIAFHINRPRFARAVAQGTHRDSPSYGNTMIIKIILRVLACNWRSRDFIEAALIYVNLRISLVGYGRHACPQIGYSSLSRPRFISGATLYGIYNLGCANTNGHDYAHAQAGYSRFRLIGPPVNRVSRLIGPNCEEQNPIEDNALR